LQVHQPVLNSHASRLLASCFALSLIVGRRCGPHSVLISFVAHLLHPRNACRFAEPYLNKPAVGSSTHELDISTRQNSPCRRARPAKQFELSNPRPSRASNRFGTTCMHHANERFFSFRGECRSHS